MADLFEGAPQDWIHKDELSPDVFAWVEKNSRANSPEYLKTLQSIQQFKQHPVLPGQSDPSGALAWDTRRGNQYVADQQALRDARLHANDALLAQHYNPALDTGGVAPAFAPDTRMAEASQRMQYQQPIPEEARIAQNQGIVDRLAGLGSSAEEMLANVFVHPESSTAAQ